MAFKFTEETSEEKEAREIQTLKKQIEKEIKNQFQDISRQAKDIFEGWLRDSAPQSPKMLAIQAFEYAKAFYELKADLKKKMFEGIEEIED